MRNISLLLSGFCLLCSVAITSSCNNDAGKSATVPAAITAAPAPEATAPTGKIAYVNMDTLEARYVLLKAKRDEFKTKQDQMESELQSSYQMMQSDAAEVQKKAQANSLTQDEYEAAQKRLMQEQKSLEGRKQTMTDQLMKEQDDFSRDLKSRLDAFLADYNKVHHYDYILSYSANSNILYANPTFDITKDVVDGMNALSNNDADKKK